MTALRPPRRARRSLVALLAGFALQAAAGPSTESAPQATSPPTREHILGAARRIMTTARYATMVTTREGEGQARVVDPLEPDPSFAVHVATNPRSRKVLEMNVNPRVTLTYFDAAGLAYVTLVGEARLVEGSQKTERYKKEWEKFFDRAKPQSYNLYRIVPSRLEVMSPQDGLSGNPLTWRPEIVDFLKPAPLGGFDTRVSQIAKDWEAPGLAMVVVKDGAVVFAKGYGVRDLGQRERVDTRTLFAIGSTTKAMTAAALGMLVDEKKLAWDDPVTRHLPWFVLKDPGATREVTIRDLLTHRAGLPNSDLLWYGQPTPPRVILDRLRLLEPAYPIRSGFIYQNVMYAAAGAVVEAASGRPWERFLEERILRPLGMTDTLSTGAALGSRTNRAEPHYRIEGRVSRIENASVDGVAPAGSVWSSVDDMSKWMRLLLAGGVTPGGVRLLSESVVSDLFRPQTMVGLSAFYPTARLTSPSWTSYGLGWFQQDYAGVKVDYHTGSIDGMVAICGLIRSHGIGVFVLSNLDHMEARHALMFTVFDELLGRPSRDWSGEFMTLYARLQAEAEQAEKKETAQRKLNTRPSLDVREYSGRYSDPLLGEVEVSMAPGSHGLRIRYGGAFVGNLDHWNFDTFRATWDAKWRGSALASFVLDPSGQAVELRLMGATFRRISNTP
jgi:CubicO group peptidase (beta-lactamase class C family)/general stress protein 26